MTRQASSRSSLGSRAALGFLLAAGLLSAPMRGREAAGWVPFDCSEVLRDDRSDDNPVPVEAFPSSDAEVARAFEDGVGFFFFDSRLEEALYDVVGTVADAVGLTEHVPSPRPGQPEVAAFLAAIRAGEVEYRLERVVNWRLRRCTGRPDDQGAFYLEGAWEGGGVHALLSGSGELGVWGFRPLEPDGRRIGGRLPTLDEAAATIAAEAGGPLEHVQYVLIMGHPHCLTIPCVAARRGETLFVLEPGLRLFAFRLEPHEEHEVAPPPGQRCLGAPCPGDPWVVAVGDRWLVGEVVGVGVSER